MKCCDCNDNNIAVNCFDKWFAKCLRNITNLNKHYIVSFFNRAWYQVVSINVLIHKNSTVVSDHKHFVCSHLANDKFQQETKQLSLVFAASKEWSLVVSQSVFAGHLFSDTYHAIASCSSFQAFVKVAIPD